MERTTIILDKPILRQVREKAKKEGKTLKATLREIILKGLSRQDRKGEALPRLPSFHLGKPPFDFSSRVRLYEMWDMEKVEDGKKNLP